MLKRWKDVKVDVTVNGSGFDIPSELVLEDDGEIPLCNLIFPGGIRSRYKLTMNDIIRVYIGLDELPDHPTFTGYMASESGIRNTMMECYGSLYKANREFVRILDTDNLDGMEIGAAIRHLFSNVTELSWMSAQIQDTNPSVYVPADDLRYEKGISIYELMKELRDIAVNNLDQFHLGRYAFFQHGDVFYFRPIPDPQNSTAWVKIAYGDTLLDVNQEGQSSYASNKVKVIGDDDVYAEYQNDHRIDVDGLLEITPISDTSIKSNGDAFEIARSKVLKDMIPEVPLVIDSPLLLEQIPNASVIEITGAPYGLSDNYLLKSKTITISEGMFQVTGTVSTPVDVVSETIAQVLGLNRDLPLTSTPAGTSLQ